MQEVPGNAARNVLRLSHHKRESAQHREIPLTDCRREFSALPRETLFNQTLRDRENHFFPIERLHLNIRRHIREGCDRKIQIDPFVQNSPAFLFIRTDHFFILIKKLRTHYFQGLFI